MIKFWGWRHKKMKKNIIIIGLLVLNFACGSSKYTPISPDPILPTPEDPVSFTNIFEYSLDLNTNNITNVYNGTSNLLNSSSNLNVSNLSTKRTFYDFFFYNQVAYTIPDINPDGRRGADFDAHMMNNIVKPLNNDEKAYWSYNEISKIASYPDDYYYDSIAPMELANIRKVLFKLGLNIDKDGYPNKSIARILVALISPQETVSLRLDLYQDLEITNVTNSSNKNIYANFTDECAVIEFKGTLKTDNSGNLILENVNLTFNNHSDAYTDPNCNYFGQIKLYDNTVQLKYIELPYTNAQTLDSTYNINPYNLNVKASGSSRTKERVLFQNITMLEIQE